MSIKSNYDHPATFKAAVALAAQKGEQSIAELAQRFGVTTAQVTQWRDRLIEGAVHVFARPEEDDAGSALLDSRQLAQTIAENSTQGFAMMDERGYCIYANGTWLQMTGYTAEEIGAKPLHDLVHHHHPDGSPYPMEDCPIDRALPESFKVRAHKDLFFRKDGSTFPVMCAASPIFEKGRPVATVVEIRDITELELAEQSERMLVIEALAAAEANAKFRTFFEQGSYFAGVMSLDGTLIEVNRLLAEGSGFRRDDVVGKKFWECGWWNRSPELMKTIEAGSRGAAAGDPFRCETAYFTADGTERIVDLIIAPVTDETGNILFVAPTGNDITERMQVEGKLRLLDAISEQTRAADDPKTIMEMTTRLLGLHLGVTRCAYADLEPDNDCFTIRHDWTVNGVSSTVGVYSLNLFGPRAAMDLRAGRTLVVCDVDSELGPVGGAEMFNAIGIKAIITCPLVKQNRLVALMAVHQSTPRRWTSSDVALVEAVVERSWAHIERVRAMEALRDADRHKSEFLATLAHELRNPLAPMRSGLQMLRLAGDAPETVCKLREMMERQLMQMVRLIDDLLDIARINRGQVELKKERVALRQVVETAIETSLPAIESMHHDFNVDLGDAALNLDIDPVRIAQVISNLLNNAAKYTPRNGCIALSVRHSEDAVLIAVTDSGAGIPAGAFDTIFEMFTQVGRNIDQAQGGLGIGLWLARRLLEMHGGSITGASPGIGLGSTFTVRLPLADEEPEEATARPAAGEAGSEAGSLRILVVDDNVDAADTMAALLEMFGHVTGVANDGHQALQKAKEFRPHAVFLDIGLPGMNGYEVARTLRNTPGLDKAALIALTGWGAADDRARAREAGFDHHLTKPAELDTIENLLGDVARLVVSSGAD